MKSKSVRNAMGHFVYTRSDEPRHFVCDRCLSPKTAKVQVSWVDDGGRERTICNGCYGRVLSDLG